MRRDLCALFAALIIVAAQARAAENAWTIGPRTLPPPAGASAELREILARTPTPTAPATPNGMRYEIAKADAMMAAAAKSFATRASIMVQGDMLGGVHVFRITPASVARDHANRLFVHIHGGAFVQGADWAALPEALEIAVFLKMPVLSIDYRMAPDYPAPAAMDDVIAVWREIVKERPPARIILGGTSAGGNLTLVSALRMKELRLPLPAALFAGTPAVDLSTTGDSRFINDGIDRNLVGWSTGAARAIAVYAGSMDPKDPTLSPINGDFTDLPPTYLISGTRDLLLSDTVRAHRKLRKAGVEADLHVYEGIAHADYISLVGTPEMTEHYAELNRFVRAHLGRAVASAANLR
jgi:acetyl esterase/lipase